MLRTTVEVFADVAGGRIVAGDPDHVVAGVAVDSREVVAGAAFIALPGERSDGHDHLDSAIDNGAHLIVITRPIDEFGDLAEHAARRGAAIVSVDDGLQALAGIAAWHRVGLRCPVVGITGSSGKTTTKDLLAAVLSRRFETVATRANRNNEIGLPLTVLSAGHSTEVLVAEMGMRGPGQITWLCEIARPTHALLTNVGTSHIELLGSQEAIADAKAELIRSVPVSGTVFINGDDEHLVRSAAESVAPVTRYGLGEHCQVRAVKIALDERSLPSFELVSPEGGVQVALSVPGRHNVYNALAAASVALSLGLTPDEVAEGLSEAPVTAMRMETFETASGVTVINDAYNANPSSMSAAVETLAAMQVTGQRIAVLGDMAELGSLEALAHFTLGEQVAASRLSALVTVGERAARIGDGARAAGMPAEKVRSCATVAEAVEVLDDLTARGDVVLVKASRVMGLESVVEGLVTSRVR